jgi:hypothetical protein
LCFGYFSDSLDGLDYGDGNKVYLIGESQTMVVNGELTIADGVKFYVINTTLTISQPVKGEGTSAKIRLDANGIVTGNGASNFYNNSNSSLSDDGVTPGKTYKWKTNISGAQGWQYE